MLRLNEYFKNREVRRNRYLTFNYEAIVYQDKYYVVSRAIYPNFFLVTGYFIEMFLVRTYVRYSLVLSRVPFLTLNSEKEILNRILHPLKGLFTNISKLHLRFVGVSG